MATGFVHTVHKGGNRVNEVEGDEATLPGAHDTKEAAVAAGHEEAVPR